MRYRQFSFLIPDRISRGSPCYPLYQKYSYTYTLFALCTKMKYSSGLITRKNNSNNIYTLYKNISVYSIFQKYSLTHRWRVSTTCKMHAVFVGRCLSDIDIPWSSIKVPEVSPCVPIRWPDVHESEIFVGFDWPAHSSVPASRPRGNPVYNSWLQ